MSTHLPRPICAAVSILILLLFSGCSLSGGIYANYRAIEDLQTVQVLGLDRNADGTVTLTAAVESAGDDPGSGILSAGGNSIPEALAHLQSRSAQGELFFAHVQYFLLGQALAEQGIGPVLDYVERDVHTRMAAALFVLRDGQAETLFTAAEDGAAVTELLASVRRETERRGDSHVYSVRDTAVALSEYGAAPICVLRTLPAAAGDAASVTVPDGYGILRGAALAGFVSGGDAEALSLLTGTLGTVSRSFPDGDGGTVTLELRGSADIACPEPALMELSLRIDAVPAAVDGAAAVTDAAYLSRLSDTVSAELEAQMLRVLGLSKSLDADFAALARYARRGAGEEPLPEDWLQQTEFHLHTETAVVHSYDLREPPGTEGRL